MKSIRLLYLGFVAVTGALLTGCLFKPVTVSTRHFVLAPITTNSPAPVATKRSVEISFVKMPSYLLRTSIAVRNGPNEIKYLEDALWGERLDQCFQRTLAANLFWLLPSDNIYSTDRKEEHVTVRVSINVHQFDVDTSGHGTLIAQWRATASNSDAPAKVGHARLARAGPPPHNDPETIATTLSELLAEFSRDLARALGQPQQIPTVNTANH